MCYNGYYNNLLLSDKILINKNSLSSDRKLKIVFLVRLSSNREVERHGEFFYTSSY